MIGYPIVFRCCECTVEEQTIDHLEKHIWSRHLQAFPFKCAQCDFPAINSVSLLEHFEQNHSQVTTIEFKRNLEDEKRFRKMIADSIAIQFDENAPQDTNQQMEVLEPINMTQGTTQIILLPSESSQYETIVDHQGPIVDEFGIDEEENEMMEDDDDDDYVDELGNPVFIGAHDEDPDFLLEDEEVRPSNSYHVKYMRTRRMDKLIDNVVVNAAHGASPDSTSNQPGPSIIDDESEDRQKIERFNCDQCSRSFKYQSKLVEHRRTHMGVRPFSCMYCAREFTQKGALKTHMRLHTGERPFACQWECGKQFTSASARRHHEKTHSGERPYLCNICGKSFTKNSHVTRHLKNIHNRDIISQVSLLAGAVVQNEHDESMNLEPDPDIAPRGKEIAVVHDIVEQIHEEKFSERKSFH